jgi:hypothetical protein
MFFALVTEQLMDVEEAVSLGDNENKKLNFVILDDMRDSDVDSLLQLKQVIASDLLSLLLSVAKVPSPSTAGIKCCTKICNDILENVIDRVSYYIHHWHFDPRSFWKMNISDLVKKSPPFTEPKIFMHLPLHHVCN